MASVVVVAAGASPPAPQSAPGPAGAGVAVPSGADDEGATDEVVELAVEECADGTGAVRIEASPPSEPSTINAVTATAAAARR
ncbi:MAG TPA: hypothetical protein VMG36_02635 [Thermoplasmata archaeon]|nr:hypothetical protein [Thermoplasmata archaeon]